jgi:hypothetical protein
VKDEGMPDGVQGEGDGDRVRMRESKNKSIMSRVRGCMMGPRVREVMTEPG